MEVKQAQVKKIINEINPEYGVISVGKNNRYGHPNDGVLENLEDSNIYRTDQDGCIMFKIKNSNLKLKHVDHRKENTKDYQRVQKTN